MMNKLMGNKNVIYVSFTVIIAILFVIVNSVISNAGDDTRAEIARVNEQNLALERELRDLEDELAFIKTDEGIELYARAQGMTEPGESHYTVH